MIHETLGRVGLLGDRWDIWTLNRLENLFYGRMRDLVGLRAGQSWDTWEFDKLEVRRHDVKKPGRFVVTNLPGRALWEPAVTRG